MHASEIVERDDMNHDDLLSRRRPIAWPSPQSEYAETVTLSAWRQCPPHARPGNGRSSVRSRSAGGCRPGRRRSEEHTSELQSLMRISYAVFCLKKKKKTTHNSYQHTTTTRKNT